MSSFTAWYPNDVSLRQVVESDVSPAVLPFDMLVSLACVWSVHACRRLQGRRDAWRLCLVSARLSASPRCRLVAWHCAWCQGTAAASAVSPHSLSQFLLHVVQSALGGTLVNSLLRFFYGLLHRHRSKRVKRKKRPMFPHFIVSLQNFRFLGLVFYQFSCSFNFGNRGLIKKRFLNFLHFVRFCSPNSDLSDGQAGANCETCWRVKSLFTESHIMSMPLFR